MNIIIASNDSDFIASVTKINSICNAIDPPTFLTAGSTDEFIHSIKSNKYDLIITEHLFDDMDIWQLSKLIHSTKLIDYARPVILITHEDDLDIPPILAREYGFHAISGNDALVLSETILSIYEDYIEYKNKGESYLLSERPRLLIIEDDELSADAVCLTLKDYYQIDLCSNGATGIECFKYYRHDLVLLDYMLPDKNGHEVLEEIMRIDPSQPVIIMTADDNPEHNKDFIANGASQYMTKPLSANHLRYQCWHVIGKAKLSYQSHYSDTKLNNIAMLLVDIDTHIESNDFSTIKDTVRAMKKLLPKPINDDLMIELLNY